MLVVVLVVFFFFNDTATTEIYTLSLHDALPIFGAPLRGQRAAAPRDGVGGRRVVSRRGLRQARRGRRSEEHTSELQSRQYLVCRLLLEKKNYMLILQIAHKLVDIVDEQCIHTTV